jgi:hypothetical protein
MSAAFVLMITDGQDTQKRAGDLEVADYAVVQAWRRRADRHTWSRYEQFNSRAQSAWVRRRSRSSAALPAAPEEGAR